MEKDKIMCEVVQNSLKSGDPKPDNSPMSELLLAIRMEHRLHVANRLAKRKVYQRHEITPAR